MDKYALLGKGLFPETLPPCFDGSDLKRALRGIVPLVRSRQFFRRSSELISFNGTKHNGARRWFATPNPVQYFYICEFIQKRWREIQQQIDRSPFVVSKPREAPASADRPVIIPSLSNLTTEASEKLRYSALIVRADISQFFPSVYTHILPWIAHGREPAKGDRAPQSTTIYFNALDYAIQHSQSGETRGLAVGPDAFRIAAEFIASDLDRKVAERCGDLIVGAARHVDDFFIGVMSEVDGLAVLSHLRHVLAEYHFQLNDNKTNIANGLEPLNELWAQDLRKEAEFNKFFADESEIIRAISRATELSRSLGSDSPLKIVLRGIDKVRVYNQPTWAAIEPYLQRICQHHSHCIDYVFLLVVKRFAHRPGELDEAAWSEVAAGLIRRHTALGHDHEVVWSLWLMITLGLNLPDDLLSELVAYDNSYVNSMLVSAYSDGRLERRPPLRYGSRIPSEGGRWLEVLVARCGGYSGGRFSGAFSEEFTHFANRRLKLVDWDTHVEKMRGAGVRAISRTRYGYDADDDEMDDGDPPDWALDMDGEEPF